MNLNCKFCGFLVSDNFYFCPNCGKKLKEPPLSTSIGKQLGIYALSIFLPPLGLLPGIKYLRQNDNKAKIIGVLAIALTIISTIVTINITLNFINNPLGNNSKQLRELQNLGY